MSDISQHGNKGRFTSRFPMGDALRHISNPYKTVWIDRFPFFCLQFVRKYGEVGLHVRSRLSSEREASNAVVTRSVQALTRHMLGIRAAVLYAIGNYPFNFFVSRRNVPRLTHSPYNASVPQHIYVYMYVCR